MIGKSSFIQEEDSSMKKAHTLVRRVSDMFKDGTYSGPPSLFSQKIRHCCQNLNLFPYLLYSFENSKSHPLAKKVNVCFDLIIQNLVHRLLFVYTSLRRVALSNLQQKSLLSLTKEIKEEQPKLQRQLSVSSSISSASSNLSDDEGDIKRAKLRRFQRQKPKPSSALLVLAIYLAPLVVAFQLFGLCGLLALGKYTPGFIFLLSALVSLGYINMKIMFHESLTIKRKAEERRSSKTKENRDNKTKEKRKGE